MSSTKWRILVTASNGTTFHQTGSEIFFYDEYGIMINTSDVIATESSTGSYPASNLVNWNWSSDWQQFAGNPPQWVAFEFPRIVDISSITIFASNLYPERSPSAFSLQYDSTGSGDWVTVHSESGLTWTSSEQKDFQVKAALEMPGYDGSAYAKWRLLMTECESLSFKQMGAELKVYDSDGVLIDLDSAIFTAISDSGHGSYVPENLIDDDLTTFQQFDDYHLPAWVQLEFSEPVVIGSISLYGTREIYLDRMPTELHVQYYDTVQEKWFSAFSQSGYSWTEEEEKTFDIDISWNLQGTPSLNSILWTWNDVLGLGGATS